MQPIVPFPKGHLVSSQDLYYSRPLIIWTPVIRIFGIRTGFARSVIDESLNIRIFGIRTRFQWSQHVRVIKG